MERHIRAFGLELLFGYMGFLGIGWITGGKWPIGIPLLIVWFPLLVGAILAIVNAGEWFGSVAAPICGTLLLFPTYLVIPLVSAYAIRRQLEPRTAPTDAAERDAAS